MDRIDTHHHFCPEPYVEAYNSATFDRSQWILPKWSAEASLELMESQGIRSAILSVTTPGPTIYEGKEASELCRKMNISGADIVKARPSDFGFFASVPSPINSMDAVLEEIAYSLDVLKADGIALFTSYGKVPQYLGHPEFRPLWDELEKRHAVVFIHPISAGVLNSLTVPINPAILDYTHETTRTAIDLILSNTLKEHPNIKIILSHAGGTLPYVASRPAHLLPDMGYSKKDAATFLDEARSFYFDLALSGNQSTLNCILDFAKPDHVFYGSDFPYAPPKSISTYRKNIDEYKMDTSTAYSVARGGALELFPRFRNSRDGAAVKAK